MNDVITKGDELDFKKYIKRRHVLIVDPSITTRAVLVKAFAQLGVQPQFIFSASNYSEAEKMIEQILPQIIVTDFNLENEYGLNLLQSQRESNPHAKDSLFIIITSNSSQTAIAQAAEEDVDAYILKPFTMDSLKSSLIKAVMFKQNPSEYIKTIEQGKNLLFAGNPETAISFFNRAINLDSKPALAYFYKAQAEKMLKALDAAEIDYKTGLAINGLHYKCLVGLFDLLIEERREAEAYEVLKKIATYFPANPKRLTQVLKLTISLQKVDDLLTYYEAFCNLDKRDPIMVNNMCAALVVAGKHFFKKGENAYALDLIKKAAISSGGNSKILRNVIFALAENNEPDEARRMLVRFAVDELESPNYAACDIVIKTHYLNDIELIKEIKVWLDEKKVNDPYLYETIIQRLVKQKSYAMAENYFYRAIQLYKDEKFTDPRNLNTKGI